MFITNMALPRRTFLRGIGTTLALPLLDAMIPALSAQSRTAANPARRFACAYMGNGANMASWTPALTGAEFAWTPSLSLLAPVRDQVLVITGLDHPEADANGDGAGAHPRCGTTFLSGVHVNASESAVSAGT